MRINELGKFLKMFRLKNNEKLYEMANKLGFSSSYLSAMEHGDKKPTKDFVDRFLTSYNLNENEVEELKKAFSKSMSTIKIIKNEDTGEIVLVRYGFRGGKSCIIEQRTLDENEIENVAFDILSLLRGNRGKKFYLYKDNTMINVRFEK